jgi:hypothetical protein
MPNQVQCPNCGEYWTVESSYRIDPKTGKRVGGWGPCIFGLLSIIGYTVTCAVSLSFQGNANEYGIPLLLLSIGLTVIFVWGMLKPAKGQEVLKYECQNCAYRWEPRANPPDQR